MPTDIYQQSVVFYVEILYPSHHYLSPFFCLPLSLVFLNNFFFLLSLSLLYYSYILIFFYIFSLSRLLPFLFGFDFVLPQQPHGIFRHFYIQTKLGFIIQEDKLPTPPPLSLSLCPLTFLSLSFSLSTHPQKKINSETLEDATY